jgi:hypothetical protein
MKVIRQSLIGLLVVFLIASGNPPTFAKPLLGSVCKPGGATVTAGGKKLVCTTKGKKLIWVIAPTPPKRLKVEIPVYAPKAPTSPTSMPEIEISLNAKYLVATVNRPSEMQISNEKIIGIKTRIWQDGRVRSTNDSIILIGNKGANFSLTWDLSTVWKQWSGSVPVIVESEYYNEDGSGKSIRKEIYIPVDTAPSASPTPSASPSSTSSNTGSETASQINASKSAASYLRYSSFSRDSLIKQLVFEGFSNSDAVYAVDKQNANWKDQAVKKAASYLKSSAFSRDSLIKQLVFEGFSNSDSTFATDSQDANWKDQAAKKAASYLKNSTFTYTELIKQLEFEGFTSVEATFGVESTGLKGSSTTQSAAPTLAEEVGCTVKYSSVLPFGSQRITITSITWEKDAAGYISALATMRNDNSMSLRLVQFTFYVFNNYSIVKLAQTLQGDNFFIKDDAKFNSVDGIAGAWAPGQSRNFRLPTNTIMKCSDIEVTSSGFSVSQGIGDS